MTSMFLTLSSASATARSPADSAGAGFDTRPLPSPIVSAFRLLIRPRAGRARRPPDGADALLAVFPRLDLAFGRELRRRLFDHRADHVAHRRDPVGDDLPGLAVPLLDQDRAVALVIGAGDLDRVGR